MKGKIIQVLPLQQGVSAAGKQWQKQGFVMEQEAQAGMQPRKLMYTLFGEDKIQKNYADAGDTVDVEFDLESREYNGKWYTDVNAWKVSIIEQAAPEATPVQAPQDTPTQDNGSLPF